MNKLLKYLIIALGLSLSALFAGTETQTSAGPGTPPTTTPPTTPGPRVDPALLPDSIKALIEQFRTQREALLAERRAKIEALKNMTEEERKAAIEQLIAAQKALNAEQRALAKTIRDEIRKLREQRRTTGG